MCSIYVLSDSFFNLFEWKIFRFLEQKFVVFKIGGNVISYEMNKILKFKTENLDFHFVSVGGELPIMILGENRRETMYLLSFEELKSQEPPVCSVLIRAQGHDQRFLSSEQFDL